MKVKAALILFIILGLSFSVFQMFFNENPKMISSKRGGSSGYRTVRRKSVKYKSKREPIIKYH